MISKIPVEKRYRCHFAKGLVHRNPTHASVVGGRRWSPVVVGGRRWSPLVVGGRRWSSVVAYRSPLVNSLYSIITHL